VVEELATAGSGTASAVYFARRILRVRTAFRTHAAALVLIALFLGVALDAATTYIAGDAGAESAAAIAVRLPTALATTASFVLIVVGSRR
jgi:hypothetical protein